MRTLAKVIFSIIGCFCIFGLPIFTNAVETLPPGMVIGDSDGVYATAEGEFFVDLVNILPGETYKKEITIRSLDLEEPFSLGMLAEFKDSKGPINWKDHLTLSLTLDGEELYHGPLLGDGSFDWSQTPLELGVCKYGTDKILKAVFTADSELTNEHYQEDSETTFLWTFVGTKDQPTEPTTEPSSSTEPTTSSSKEPTKPSTTPSQSVPPAQTKSDGTSGKQYPKTGEDLRDAVYKFLAGILLVLIVLFLWKKKREEEQR
ncbi:cell wall protein [Enterococcus sp. DIV0756]|uniref:cell wall protein n=1 Tax=Enterococcus sp. DIV0756 TaxID=2774636 RepID=UPI003F239FA9